MFHLPPGFGVPEGMLSFDQMRAMWMAIQVAILVVLAGAMWLMARCPAHAADHAAARGRVVRALQPARRRPQRRGARRRG